MMNHQKTPPSNPAPLSKKYLIHLHYSRKLCTSSISIGGDLIDRQNLEIFKHENQFILSLLKSQFFVLLNDHQRGKKQQRLSNKILEKISQFTESSKQSSQPTQNHEKSFFQFLDKHLKVSLQYSKAE